MERQTCDSLSPVPLPPPHPLLEFQVLLFCYSVIRCTASQAIKFVLKSGADLRFCKTMDTAPVRFEQCACLLPSFYRYTKLYCLTGLLCSGCD